jgi:hypothetical protein
LKAFLKLSSPGFQLFLIFLLQPESHASRRFFSSFFGIRENTVLLAISRSRRTIEPGPDQ